MNPATSLRPRWLPQHFAQSVTCVTVFSVANGYAHCGEISVKREIMTICHRAVTMAKGSKLKRAQLLYLRIVLAGVGTGLIFLVASLTGTGLIAEKGHISVQQVINRVETQTPRVQSAQSVKPVPDDLVLAVNYVPAYVGQELLTGDGVKTYPNSEARVDIVIRDFTRITRTTPNTIWRIGQFAVDRDTVIELHQGKIFLFDEGARGGGRPLHVVTPAGTASPRGTWLSVEYDPETEEVKVECFRGVCQLENDLGTQILTFEQKSSATIYQAPEPPQIMTEEDLDPFIELPEVQNGEIEIPEPEPPDSLPPPLRALILEAKQRELSLAVAAPAIGAEQPTESEPAQTSKSVSSGEAEPPALGSRSAITRTSQEPDDPPAQPPQPPIDDAGNDDAGITDFDGSTEPDDQVGEVRGDNTAVDRRSSNAPERETDQLSNRQIKGSARQGARKDEEERGKEEREKAEKKEREAQEKFVGEYREALKRAGEQYLKALEIIEEQFREERQKVEAKYRADLEKSESKPLEGVERVLHIGRWAVAGPEPRWVATGRSCCFLTQRLANAIGLAF